MKCYEIIEKLETLSPPSYAEEWDNIGLLVGRRDKEVRRIYIALDATDDVIEDAIRVQADMLLTHHPMIFHKINRVNTDDFIGKRICHLIRSDMVYYAMHTNFDVKGMGMLLYSRIFKVAWMPSSFGIITSMIKSWISSAFKIRMASSPSYALYTL